MSRINLTTAYLNRKLALSTNAIRLGKENDSLKLMDKIKSSGVFLGYLRLAHNMHGKIRKVSTFCKLQQRF